MRVQELIEKRAKVWETAKNFVDTHEDKNGNLSAEDKETYSRMEAEIEELTNSIERQQRAERREQELSKPVNSPITGKPYKDEPQGEVKTGRASDEYKKAMLTALRSNFRQVSNVLQEGVDADGGYLVPEEYDHRLIDVLTEENIMRGIATKITTSGEHKINIAATKPAAAWIEEGEALSFGDATFEQKILDAHKLHVAIKITEELLYDNAFGLENYIITEFGKALANAEEDAFLNGDGVGKPTGIFDKTKGGESIGTLTAALKSDDILDLIYKLKRPYRKNASFIMNDATINEEEGKWVKYIYEQYLAGASIKGLTIDLKEKGVRGKRGDLMGRTTLRRILSTETYVGDLLLQRYFSPEIHKPKLNEGEMEQILVSNAHEPLVSREDYAKVQERLNRRAKAADNHGYEKTFFAGLVKCGKCGYACNHVLYHRQPADKAYIECNKRKTKECDLLPIRELELKGIMEQIAGCRENVERIILFDGHIDFLMKDGTVKSHIREFTPLGRKATPFSGKISCGYCGSSIVRCGSSNRRKCWMCSIKKTDKDGCEHELMSDGELYGAAQSILGTEENLDMEIYLHIEKTISYNDRIEFYMKEGGKKVWQRR